MTAMRRPLAVILVDDGTTATLCGRAATDWLLDTVEALEPASVTVAGHEGDATAAAEPAAVRLVLPCSVPLVRPATLRRAVDEVVAAAGRESAALVLDLARPLPWWADRTSSTDTPGPVVLAVAGPAHATPSTLAAASTGAALAHELLGAAGFALRSGAVEGVESAWLCDPGDRARAESALYQLIAAGWMAKGVRIDDPATTRVDATVDLGDGVRLRPHTEVLGATVIGSGSEVGPATTIRDCRIGTDSRIQYSVCQDSDVGDRAMVGPYTWLRSGTRLGARCRAGAFVELADTVVGDDSNIPHLSGLFTADVGRGCNLGSMSGPANYDGVRKHRTRIGDGVMIGAGSILVAPVSIGDGATTAAGSVITEDVPSGALGMARAPQRNVAGWAALQRRHAG